MANAVPVSSSLVLVMENGTSSTGRTLTKKLTFKSLKVNAVADDIYNVAQGLISLQEKENLAVYKADMVEITE
ncbi:DUF1659 domain-containing protein [Thermosyntropha sp.]|uniref:DUF1659 domain-containing protein n=1 Tax=Thermosyntropha sp. TaxID=2740820 RepID=UPI0025E2DD33|nr:DUF1659 domain-containing protein [Thermosyntropha sp.]MBO8159065.1 DUF1659 domain-containing protein [Thermosyntropha sp.]